MAARPSVSVYSSSSDAVVGNVPLPAVFTAPIRSDIVQFVHTNMAKNSRQAYAVNRLSGMNHSAHSWGTGRAVARIPRISGGGSSSSGSGAFGNMCRGGRMFAPTKIFRRWHRKINLHQKRLAVVSALAASSLPSLVMSRGHKIENIPEVPLVVEDSIQGYEKTKEAVAFLRAIAAIDDINRVNDSRELRAGRGKMRNRRYVARRGPMLVLPDNKGTRAFRNIFGLDLANVNALNLLHLAPGGHVGRFVIWTKGAFEQLDAIFGTFTEASAVKKGFVLPAPMLTNTDVTRILQSEEVRRVLKPKKLQPKKASGRRQPTNGIKNRRLRLRLNPYVKKETQAAKSLRNPKNRDARRKAKSERIAKVKKSLAKAQKKNKK
ncbi:Ribosomal protein L4/L1 family/60S ribosomal protein L4 C-terminal domain containing protein, putative [Angomonas deanei]|uniref:Ribosomal protein L4/L1 family/60S ribosomal protein L4 C-terminal domain containing protein, putative n=1 Tax=Angomonas deanei TaxID=59799 RepID=A0A7G2CHF9_9TRYP|nr:Ribosomal protein L4/L1 family/60S ribosomal protein L4 C-terminal domain containing protein, putative [Angomonas deanei]